MTWQEKEFCVYFSSWRQVKSTQDILGALWAILRLISLVPWLRLSFKTIYWFKLQVKYSPVCSLVVCGFKQQNNIERFCYTSIYVCNLFFPVCIPRLEKRCIIVHYYCIVGSMLMRTRGKTRKHFSMIFYITGTTKRDVCVFSISFVHRKLYPKSLYLGDNDIFERWYWSGLALFCLQYNIAVYLSSFFFSHNKWNISKNGNQI